REDEQQTMNSAGMRTVLRTHSDDGPIEEFNPLVHKETGLSHAMVLCAGKKMRSGRGLSVLQHGEKPTLMKSQTQSLCDFLRQFSHKRLAPLKFFGVNPFGEPAVALRQHLPGLFLLSLPPQATQAHHCP